MSELVSPDFSKPRKLLGMVSGLELTELDRVDECCGFGGLFCIAEEAVSVKMGKDRITDHTKHGAEYITSPDLSCLMQMKNVSTGMMVHFGGSDKNATRLLIKLRNGKNCVKRPQPLNPM
jgi:L-lactate dehydrogenase complex protein LldE